MNHPNRPSIAEVLEQTAQAIMQLLREGLSALHKLSWPALMVACVLLAFVLTLLPLALTLFAAFLLLKLIVGALVITKHHERGDAPEEHQQ